MDKVCVAIVTFNRKKYLLNLLEHLQISDYPISSIVIVDNASTDGTDKELLDHYIISEIKSDSITFNKWKDIEIYYYLSSVNTGGSGGFNRAFDLALKYDWQYIWVMDDDVWPEIGCLTKLINYMSPDAKVCVPSRTDDNFKDKVIVKFDLKNPFKLRSKRKTYVTNYMDRDYIEIEDMPFEGPLFAREVVENIGLPDKEYFILYDDTDYALRARKITNIRYIPSAVLHKSIIPSRTKHSPMTWKQYYGLRNAIHFDITYGENVFVRKFSPKLLLITMLMKAVLRRKFKTIKIILRAYNDGIHGRRGKTVEPGEF